MSNVYFEPDPDRLVQIGNRMMREVEVTVPRAWIEKMARGYMCCQCFEPVPHAYPEHCPLCGFAMYDEQPDVFRAEFKGQIDQYLPDYDAMLEESRRNLLKKGVWLPG